MVLFYRPFFGGMGGFYANYREWNGNYWIAKKMRKLRKDAKTCWMLEHPRFFYANYRELNGNYWIAKKMRKGRKDAKNCWMLEHPRFFLRELSRIKRELSVNLALTLGWICNPAAMNIRIFNPIKMLFRIINAGGCLRKNYENTKALRKNGWMLRIHGGFLRELSRMERELLDCEKNAKIAKGCENLLDAGASKVFLRELSRMERELSVNYFFGGDFTLGWICNPAAMSIRIFNPIKMLFSITNAHNQCGRIANPPELVFNPIKNNISHYKCSYSERADCKSARACKSARGKK